MAARKNLFVSPDGSDWVVTHNGQVLSRHRTKAAAVDAGAKAGRASQPSSLRIMRADGTFEDERTYLHDPFPPRG